MDKYLFSKFVVPFKDNLEKSIYKSILINAQVKVNCNNAIYYNYYPQERKDLQLILETDNNYNTKDFMVHHTSNVLWKLKILNKIDNNIYLVYSLYNNAVFPIRLVNLKVLGVIKEDSYIMAQICAFVIKGKIYKNKKEYDNNKINIEDSGCLLRIKGIIKKVAVYKLDMFFLRLCPYYCIIVNYNNEELPIFITDDFIDNDIEVIGKGNYFDGYVMMSGDVCIDQYERYISVNDYIK